LSPALTTFLFEVANFLILAGVLAWLLFRPVRAALEKRRQTIADEQQQAADKLAEAERARAEVGQRLAELDDELQRERDSSREQATQEADRILAEARESAERERAALKRQLTYLEHARIERLAQVVAQTAGQTVGRLLRDISATDLDGALLQAACRELAAFDGNSIAPVVVESAKELSAEQQAALKSSIGAAEDAIEFRQADDLKAGLRISTNRGLIDLSDAGLAEFAERALATQLQTEALSNNHSETHA
jgi:F-type H+-transporting ATPase subunit b